MGCFNDCRRLIAAAWRAALVGALLTAGVPAAAEAMTRAELQALLDAMPNTSVAPGGTVNVPAGVIDLGTTPLIISRNGQTIKCAGAMATRFVFSGVGGAIRNADITRRHHIVIEDCGFDIMAEGGVGIDWTWWNYSTFNRLDIRLVASNTRGTYAYGTSGSPYYNLFTRIDIGMKDVYEETTGSVGHYLDEEITGQGPNANTFTGGRIAGGSVHVLIKAGHGNAFRDITSESATVYHVQMGNPYPGGTWWRSGFGNEVTGWYVEGAVQFNPCFARTELRRDGTPSITHSVYGPEQQRLIVSLGAGKFSC